MRSTPGTTSDSCIFIHSSGGARYSTPSDLAQRTVSSCADVHNRGLRRTSGHVTIEIGFRAFLRNILLSDPCLEAGLTYDHMQGVLACAHKIAVQDIGDVSLEIVVQATPSLLHVEVRSEDGRALSLTQVVTSETEVLYVAHQLWELFIPTLVWGPVQKRVMRLPSCRLGSQAELSLLRIANVVSTRTSVTTLITAEAVAAMLGSRPGMECILQQLGIPLINPPR